MIAMLVFNIRKEKYAHGLFASGVANRWNKTDEFVIYTGSSRALSALELVVHKSVINVHSSYKVMVIKMNVKESDITTVEIQNLPKNWQSIGGYPASQQIGSEWYHSQKTLVLRVPSVIIPQEFNYLLNTRHPDFLKKVKLATTERFLWDERLV